MRGLVRNYIWGGGANHKGHVPRLNGTSSLYMFLKEDLGSLTQKFKPRLYWPNCLFVAFHHEMNLGRFVAKESHHDSTSK